MYAIAIDLGTTTLAVSLVDTDKRSRLAMSGAMNPQRRFGADVVSRLDAAVQSEDTLREMTGLIRAELLRLALDVCHKGDIPWDRVEQIALAGNPAMQHILLELPVRSLAYPPYRPLHTEGQTLTAGDLGWPGTAGVYIFPMPGGFVGGDTVAFLYGQEQGPGTRDQGPVNAPTNPQSPVPSPRYPVPNPRSPVPASPSLYLDMGTNGEMALVAGETIWSTSAAAGPAFEGGNLSCGMAALPGAISSVRIDGERLRLATIGKTVPAGMCGSAAIETVTQLLEHGLLEPGGRLKESGEIDSNLGNRIITHNGENAFVLHRDARSLLLLTQSDIRQIQLAKSAIRAGMEVLAERSRIQFQTLQDVVLTGSFGAVLNPEWLKSIGIFDKSMLHITRFTPEGALAGAEKALCTRDGYASVAATAQRFRVVPLSGTPLFEELFLRHIDFPR